MLHLKTTVHAHPRRVCAENFEEISMARMQGVRKAGTEIGENRSRLQISLEVFGFYLKGKGEFKGWNQGSDLCYDKDIKQQIVVQRVYWLW